MDCSEPDCGTISPVRSMISAQWAATPSTVTSLATTGVDALEPWIRSYAPALGLAAGDQVLTAREAVAAAALFGITENSLRVTLARLCATQLIQATERGAYRLGSAGTGLAGEVASWRTAEQRVRTWMRASSQQRRKPRMLTRQLAQAVRKRTQHTLPVAAERPALM